MELDLKLELLWWGKGKFFSWDFLRSYKYLVIFIKEEMVGK
jgi:hypothetical protein